MLKKRNLIFLSLLILGVFLITGCWLIPSPTYTVTFDSQGGSAVDLQTVERGGLVIEPTAPTRTGYAFSGWYEESGCTNAWDFNTDTVTSDVTLYAKWATNTYTVTFDSQGGSTVSSQTVAHGGKVTEPTAPIWAGHTFGGWYEESGCTNAWDFNTDTVTSDVTLYAKWATNTYTVTFDSQGGSAVDPQKVKHGRKATEPEDPTRTGYTFGGWYKESGCTNPWDFATDKVTSDVTLYAKWATNTYTVNFNSQGGSAVDPQTVEHGGLATEPTAPIWAGYTFGGWYEESGCTNPWDFDTDTVTSDVTLYAKWATNTYTVTFNSQGGSAVDPQTVEHGGLATEPTAPIWAGYAFAGWYKELECTNAWDFNTDTVISNVTLYAKWMGSVHNITQDTYYIAIQPALNDAATGDNIEVNDGTYAESITFPNGMLITLKSVNGASSTFITGDNDSATVTCINSLQNTTLEGFTITHNSGYTGKGIAIAVGYLTINNCTISDNSVTADYGGGIYNNHGTLTITDSEISGNSSADYAGGIYNDNGTLTITDSTISGNSSVADGGGIYNEQGTVIITDSTISGNSSAYYAGGIHQWYGTLTIIDSEISGNSSADYGGGIYNEHGTVIITGSTISGNSSATYGGGGIYNEDILRYIIGMAI
jgi:uncharacterized repeat protein (TIGR02543 family)